MSSQLDVFRWLFFCWFSCLPRSVLGNIQQGPSTIKVQSPFQRLEQKSAETCVVLFFSLTSTLIQSVFPDILWFSLVCVGLSRTRTQELLFFLKVSFCFKERKQQSTYNRSTFYGNSVQLTSQLSSFIRLKCEVAYFYHYQGKTKEEGSSADSL